MAGAIALMELGAQSPELRRLRDQIEEAGESLTALNGRVKTGYPQMLAAVWEGEAHMQFIQSLEEAARTLSALETAYRTLANQLADAADEYDRAETEAMRLAGAS